MGETSPRQHLNKTKDPECCIHDCAKTEIRKNKKKSKNTKETKKILLFIPNRFISIEYCVNMYYVVNFLS